MKKKNYSKPSVELMKVECKNTLLAESYVEFRETPAGELSERGTLDWEF